MSKREAKDPHAVVLIRRLLQIIDLGMIEDLQSAEQTMNVSRNLEIAGDLGVKKGKNFFSKSSEKINKILHKSGELSTAFENSEIWYRNDCMLWGNSEGNILHVLVFSQLY